MGLFDRITSGFVDALSRAMSPAIESARARALADAEALYRGEQYEGRGLGPSWDKTPAGAKRVPLRLQKPSVQYDLPRLIVDRPVALLFGSGRAPTPAFEPEGGGDPKDVNAWLAAIADEGNLAAALLTWGKLSCAAGGGYLTWTVVAGEDDREGGEFEFQAHRALHCRPTFDPKRAGVLLALEKLYTFCREEIETLPDGREVARQVEWWHRETWDATAHVVYEPTRKADGRRPSVEAARVEHGLGFCPAVHVKPVDDAEPARAEGPPLTDGLGDLFEDIDRTLSQKARALRYNLDPERVYFGLSEQEKARLEAGGPATTALGAKDKGTAVELLEMSGEPQRIADEHVTGQRNRALETARVVSPDPDKLLAAARSGKALEILHAAMLELVDELRVSFGAALRRLWRQILRAARSGALARAGRLATPPPAAIPPGKVKLRWGRYFNPTPEDLQLVANTVATLVREGVCDQETATRWAAQWFGWDDVEAILARLAKERADARAMLPPQFAQPQQPGTQPTPPARAAGEDGDEDDDPADGARRPADDQPAEE